MSNQEKIDSYLNNFEVRLNEEKKYSGLIIASSFSMMILLLTFISNRDFILDLGIGAIILSIFFQYYIFRKAPLNIKSFKEIDEALQFSFREMKIREICHLLGEYFFLISIALILSFFKLFIYSFFLILVIILKELKNIINDSKYFKLNREFKDLGVPIGSEDYLIIKHNLSIIKITFLLSSFHLILSAYFVILLLDYGSIMSF